MSHDPKLEIYKIHIKSKDTGSLINFREFFRKKLNYSSLPKPVTEDDIFKTYYIDFVKSIDKEQYNKNDRKKKAFTLAYEEKDGKRNSFISVPFSNDFIISGLLLGGKYGITRTLGEVDNTASSSAIKTQNVIGDKFYFLIYTPINSPFGILMIQGYTELKISDVLKDYIQDYYKIDKSIICQSEIYIPNSFKEKYLNSAVFKSLKFTTDYIIKPDFEDPLPSEYELEVKIEIIDKNEKKVNYSFAEKILKKFGESVFKMIGGNEKTLDNFKKKNAKMVSNGKELPIDFDQEDNIKPVILLTQQGIKVDNTGTPDFIAINKYCRELLTEIIEDLKPQNGVKPL